jgi:ferrous iron transport protein A
MSIQTDLGNLKPGERAVVIAIHGGFGVTARLDAMGIRSGIVLEKISGQPFGGPVAVQVGSSRIALGFGMARKILVKTDRGGDPS